ncbi:MAG TPA: condensation domain-containing protein [Ktedonobacteraceae bacterium]|nr:condensation domain-containing protein [Ktedonobacteraceae bacterium]
MSETDQPGQWSDKQKVIALLLEKKGIATRRDVSARRKSAEDISPLSYSQQWLWDFEIFRPESIYYNILNYAYINGQLRIKFLEDSLNDLIQRHETLRTTFILREEKPLQKIHETLPLSLSVIDLTALRSREQAERVQCLAQAEGTQPFDLYNGPLITCKILKLTEDRYVLLLSLHHLISDGWSRGVLIHELHELYRSKLLGEPAQLSPLPFQYADFVSQQRQKLQGKTLERHQAFWQNTLSGVAPILSHLRGYSLANAGTLHGEQQVFTMADEVRSVLISLNHRCNTTLFMTLLSAFQTLIYQEELQQDFIIYSRIANRTQPGLQQLIGCFFGMLALRSNVVDNPSFLQLLERTKRSCISAYSYSDTPFEEVRRIIRSLNGLESNAPIQVVFEIIDFPPPETSESLLNIAPLPFKVERNMFPFALDITVMNAHDQTNVIMEYNTTYFQAENIADLWRDLISIIKIASEQPQLTVQQIQRLSQVPDDKCSY